jgi:hypothetical protein
MTESDYNLIRQLRLADVLQDIHMNPIELECTVVILCADGHRFDDKYKHTKGCCGNHLHPLTRHGGALVLAERSPFAKVIDEGIVVHHDLCLLHEIGEAMAIKNTNAIVSMAHIPCAKATAAGLSAAEMLLFQVGGKARVRKKYPHCDIRCFVHIDYLGWPGHNRFATYFLNRNKLLAWAKSEHATPYPALQALAA